MNSAKDTTAEAPRGARKVVNGARTWLVAQRVFWLDYLVILSVLTVVYVAIILLYSQYFPDSAHYLGMSLWFSGMTQQDALELVNARHIANGWDPNTSVDLLFNWGLVKPRVVLPLLSVPFIWLFGPAGLTVTTGIITLVLVLVLYKLLAARYGRVASVVSVLLMLSSMFIMVFSVGMLTESLSALWGVAALAAAYRYQSDPRKRWIVIMVAVTLLSAFTRQATFIVAGAFVVAWLLSFAVPRATRGWTVPTIAVAGSALLAQLVQTWLFPFSQGDQYMRMTQTDSLWGAILATPKLIVGILREELATYVLEDQVLLILIGLALISMVVFWRRTESHLLFGAILGISLYNITNGNATHFRYAIPGIVFFLGSISLLLVHLQASARGGPPAARSDPETPTAA